MAGSKAPLTLLKDLRTSSHQIPSFDRIPNTSIQKKPLLIYHSAFPAGTSASIIESHLKAINMVEPQWRYTMYRSDKALSFGQQRDNNHNSTSHFHSTSHEVLCVFKGTARLCFGHEDNPKRVEAVVEEGDVMVVPAGVSHRLYVYF